MLGYNCYRLEEAEDRYNSRDSRPEDLELIQQLRDAVLEREERMKALVVSLCMKSSVFYLWHA